MVFEGQKLNNSELSFHFDYSLLQISELDPSLLFPPSPAEQSRELAAILVNIISYIVQQDIISRVNNFSSVE